MRAAASPASVLTWKPMHGGFRGTSRDGLREYHIQPVPIGGVEGWWAVTASADVTVRRLIRSREGAMQLDEAWEANPGRIG